MKFVVLNGSPKGNELSSTMQYLYFMQKKVPGHEYKIFTIAKNIKKIQNDKKELDQILKSIEECDAVIWSLPVFLFLVPSQVKQFIEIIFEKKKVNSFKGKYATAIFTSAMVFDHTAHNYMHAISEDLGMKFIRGYSALMQDLQYKEPQESAENFFSHFIANIEEKAFVPKRFLPVNKSNTVYKAPAGKINKNTEKLTDKKVLLLADHGPETNLEQMVKTYKECSKYEVEILNIKSDLEIKGPCLDCLKCVFTGQCVHKDDIKGLYDEKIIPAHALIFAGTMVDRYFSARWKLFFDRSFFNGHRPVLAGKQSALLVSGPLQQTPDLLQLFEGLFQYTKMEVVGSVTDEEADNNRTYELISQLAADVDRRLEKGPVFQQNFLSKGAHVILRDTIYTASAILNADHKYFKKSGLYDFPQKWSKDRALNIMLHLFMRVPPMRKMIKKDVLKFMIMPVTKVIEKI